MSPSIIFHEIPFDYSKTEGNVGTSMLAINFSGSVANISWQPKITNRIVGLNSNDFIHVSFANLFVDGLDEYFQYIKDVLTHGVQVQRRVFLYCGHSNSQLKSRSCFLYASNDLSEGRKLIYSLGNFSNIPYVGKRAKRIGLLFSSSEYVHELKQENSGEIKDIEKHGQVFTDGCGLISEKFVVEITKKIKHRQNNGTNKAYLPNVFQIRYKGYKGILMVAKDKEFVKATNEITKQHNGMFQNIINWFRSGVHLVPPGNSKEMKVIFRESMRKFENCPLDDFCILGYSKPSSAGKLNGELVSILSTLGIPDEIFLRKQNQYFNFIRNASKCPKAAKDFLEYKGRFDLIKKFKYIQQMDIAPQNLQRHIRVLQKEELKNSFDKYDLERVHIRIPDSRLLFGVCDISGKLLEGQCSIRITTDRNSLTTLILKGPVLVGRNPCLYPGDIQIFNAVENIPELDHLVDCIVFSTNGNLPPASLMSGGDLDGDKFFICWDNDLRPLKCVAPLDYSLLQPTVKDEKSIGDLDMINYFAHYSTSLGEVMTLYWAWIRGNSKERASSDQCVLLSKLYSKCVDGERVQIPGYLKRTPIPDKSNPFILDVLKSNFVSCIEGKFDTFLDSSNDDTILNHLAIQAPCRNLIFSRIRGALKKSGSAIIWILLSFLTIFKWTASSLKQFHGRERSWIKYFKTGGRNKTYFRAARLFKNTSGKRNRLVWIDSQNAQKRKTRNEMKLMNI